MSCVSCKNPIERLELLKCSGCQDKYHYGCLNISSAAFREQAEKLRRTVKCESCLNVTRRIRVTDDTPIRGGNAAMQKQMPVDMDQSLEGSTTVGLGNSTLPKLDSVFDMSVFINMINEAVAAKIASLETKFADVFTAKICTLETKLIQEIQAARVPTTEERENLQLKAELKEAKGEITLLHAELQDLKSKLEASQVANKSLKQATKNKKTRTDNIVQTELPMISSENLSITSIESTASSIAVVTSPATQPMISYAAVASKVPDASGKERSKPTTDGDWIEVKTKKTLDVVKKGGNNSKLIIKAVERKKHLHVWRLLPETTTENLTEYIKSLLGEEEYIKVDKINQKTKRSYSSFRICVSESNYEKLCDANVWPSNVEYCEWTWFRRVTDKTSSSE